MSDKIFNDDGKSRREINVEFKRLATFSLDEIEQQVMSERVAGMLQENVSHDEIHTPGFRYDESKITGRPHHGPFTVEANIQASLGEPHGPLGTRR